MWLQKAENDALGASFGAMWSQSGENDALGASNGAMWSQSGENDAQAVARPRAILTRTSQDPRGTMNRCSLVAFGALAAGCDPCHGWDELKVIDRAQVDDGDALDTVQDAIDTFIRWTERDTTCVRKVVLVEDLVVDGGHPKGSYTGRRNLIRIDHRKSWWTMWDTTVHEFCHSVDHELGWISLDHAAVLEPHTTDLRHGAYSTEEARTKEAFANLCAHGPTLPPIWRQYVEHCGEEWVDPGYRLVQELLFTAHESDEEIGFFDGTVELWELEAGAAFASSEGPYGAPGAALSGSLLVLDTVYSCDETGEWEGNTSLLRLLDPWNAQELDSIDLAFSEEVGRDPVGNPYYQSHELLGSSKGPLVYDRHQPGEAMRVHAAPLRLELVDFPRLPSGVLVQGFEHQGRMLAWIRGGELDTIATAQLEDEWWTPVELGDDARVIAFTADEEEGVALLEGPDGLTMIALDLEGEPRWTAELGCRGCYGHTLQRLPDGSYLTMTSVGTGHSWNGWFPLRFDPSSATVSAPVGACNSVGWFLRGVSIGGSQWSFYRPGTGDVALYLVEVDIDEP